MTFCYWGGFAGGKKHIQFLCTLNNQKYSVVYDNMIKVYDNTCHWNGYLNRRDHINRTNQCWDVTKRSTILYHYKDELCSVSKERRDLNYIFVPFAITYDVINDSGKLKLINVEYPVGAVVNPSTGVYRAIKRKNLNNKKKGANVDYTPIQMDKRDAKRFIKDPKYKDLLLRYEAVNQLKNNNKKMTIDDIPDCFLIIPYRHNVNKNYGGTNFDQDWNRYRNIVPYKSDLVDSARNYLDLFGPEHSIENAKESRVFETYRTDKESLWRYLDRYIFDNYRNIAQRLQKAGVRFEYFNLDKGNYKKTFGFTKELPRQLTCNIPHQLKNPENKQPSRKNFQRLTEIAKEYVALRGREDNRI